MKHLSEQYFLQKCIISAEDAKGSYSMMSHLDVDQQTKQVYDSMVADIGKHLNFLNDRLKYLKQLNQPNSQK